MINNKYEVLSSEALENINQNSLQVLERVGVKFFHQKALDFFREAGVEVKNDSVFLKEDFVREIVGFAPASFTVKGRDSNNEVLIGKNHVALTPGYGASIVMDRNGRRPAVRDDFINFARLSGASSNQQITGGILVDPSDVADHTRHLWMIYDLLNNSTKPYLSIPYGSEIANDCITMASIAFGGLERIKNQPVTLALINTLTPLKYDDRMTGAMIKYAEAGQPLIISSVPIAGISSPCTLAGTLVLQTAEILAGVVLSQLVRPGTPVLYGTASSIANMKYGSITMGSAENALLQCASAQIARSWDLPCRGSGLMTDSIDIDIQAGYESTLTSVFNYLGGADLIIHSSGLLESTKVMSYHKFLLDDEMCGMFHHFFTGINNGPAELAFDVIAEYANKGSFIDSEHTFKYFKKEFFPSVLFNKQPYDTWLQRGGKTMADMLEERYQHIMDEYEPEPLNPEVEKELLAYISSKKPE